jgi:hypothetical protein
LRLIEPAAVMIARQIVDLLAMVPLEHTELTDDLLPFRVLRRALCAGHIAQIQRDIPCEARRTL